ncbi:WD domain, G-beta repeat protein [Cooperia oncophora]
MKLTVGSISAYPNNLSVCYLESRNITYACVVQKTQVTTLFRCEYLQIATKSIMVPDLTVHTVNWDSKNESVSWDSINISDISTDKPVNVLQGNKSNNNAICSKYGTNMASLVLPNARTLPLLVVGTTIGAQIFDMRTQKLLEQQLIDTGISEPDDTSFWSSFCRGITCNDNTILVGTSIGHIMQFHCSGETSITTKKWLKEHTASISDLATCRYDDITCSGDSSGKINVWNKSIKGVQLKIATQHPITAMSVLRKQVIVGTLRGRVLFYSISGGELMAEVLAHARAITCISVAPESAYVLTGSEDGRFIVCINCTHRKTSKPIR